MWLWDAHNHLLARIDGSVENFQSLLLAIEDRTRRQSVTFFEGNPLDGWKERRGHGEQGRWVVSKGPEPIRQRNHRIDILLAVGFVLIAAMSWLVA